MTREAELELEIARLREALDKCSKQLSRLGYSANHADEALSTPPSTTALQELIEKVERRTIERCAEKVGRINYWNVAEVISVLPAVLMLEDLE